MKINELEDYKDSKKLKNGDKIESKNLNEIIQDILHVKMWCKLEYKDEIKVHLEVFRVHSAVEKSRCNMFNRHSLATNTLSEAEGARLLRDQHASEDPLWRTKRPRQS